MKPVCLTVICLVLMHTLPQAGTGDAIVLFIVALLFSFLVFGAPAGKQ